MQVLGVRGVEGGYMIIPQCAAAVRKKGGREEDIGSRWQSIGVLGRKGGRGGVAGIHLHKFHQ